jgi:hypothetical protein
MARTRAGSRRIAATPPQPTTTAMHCASAWQARSGPVVPLDVGAPPAATSVRGSGCAAGSAIAGAVAGAGSGWGSEAAALGCGSTGDGARGASTAGAAGGVVGGVGAQPAAARTRSREGMRTMAGGHVAEIGDRARSDPRLVVIAPCSPSCIRPRHDPIARRRVALASRRDSHRRSRRRTRWRCRSRHPGPWRSR